MKFAKELDEDLVPEWRVKYFNYKVGKKKIKAVSRALRAASKTPPAPGRPRLNPTISSEQVPYTHYDFKRKDEQTPKIKTPQPPKKGPEQKKPERNGIANASGGLDRRQSVTMFANTPSALLPQEMSVVPTITEEVDDEDDDDDDDSSSDDDLRNEDERPLQKTPTGGRRRYGSIIPSPPAGAKTADSLPALELPDPAIDPSQQRSSMEQGATIEDDSELSPRNSRLTKAPTGAPDYWDGRDDHHDHSKKHRFSNLPKRLLRKRGEKPNAPSRSKSRLRNAFATLTLDSPAVSTSQFEAYRELDAKQEDFFSFLDKELDKIERFHKQKEEEASSRLHVLREQLHEMRDRRLDDIKTAKTGGKIADDGLMDGQIPIMSEAFQNGESDPKGLFKPVANIFQSNGKIGKTSEARQELSTPQGSIRGKQRNDWKDYVRKQPGHEKVPYRFAKRKLRLALQEFYRGLELLKSYALLNRTAFRKINKKYDKAVMARPPLRYMNEKVNNAHFVQSTFIEATLVSVEDLYARYFERGNRKVAVSKLRSNLRAGDQSSVAFRNGIYVAAGVGFAITGIIDGAGYLFSEDIQVKTEASFLFQMYGGYFLAVLLFLFFVLNCRIWTQYRINYTFVFEYDTRHTLDWRQLSELPCIFLFLNGLFLWLNFQFHVEHTMYRLWPVFMVGITVVIIFLPFKIFYYRARKWFLYSNWRLLLAGLYPVEFRDFYLGDMYCSETYTMSQVEVFFCIYVNNWDNPQRCTSSHSRLLGFLTALPAIWRALQCLRRYYDSRNWFPHLANFAKYCCNILYYMSLSLYRIHLSPRMKAMFIVFACVNALYSSFWDVFMDFSLGNPWSKNFLLRDQLGFRHKWVYYVVVVLDVVLRQQWIFYAIFTEDLQHNTITSFLVGLAEVFRRGIWSLFRVENEHCNNVQQFRASRDIPLPYSVPDSPEQKAKRGSIQEPPSPKSTRSDGKPPKSPYRAGINASESGNLAQTETNSSGGYNSYLKSTPGLNALQRVGTIIAKAHAQDFQKKRDIEASSPREADIVGRRLTASDEDDDDDESDGDIRNPSLRHLDSREGNDNNTIRRRTRRDEHEEDLEGGISRSMSASASGSGIERPSSHRAERDASTVREADEMDDAEINEIRDRIGRAGH